MLLMNTRSSGSCCLSPGRSRPEKKADGPVEPPSPAHQQRAVGMDTPAPSAALTVTEIVTAPVDHERALTSLPAVLCGSVLPRYYYRCASSTTRWRQLHRLRRIGRHRTDRRQRARVVPVKFYGGPDINSFPKAMLNGVETVTGVASAAYGTDRGVRRRLLLEGSKVTPPTPSPRYGDNSGVPCSRLGRSPGETVLGRTHRSEPHRRTTSWTVRGRMPQLRRAGTWCSPPRDVISAGCRHGDTSTPAACASAISDDATFVPCRVRRQPRSRLRDGAAPTTIAPKSSRLADVASTLHPVRRAYSKQELRADLGGLFCPASRAAVAPHTISQRFCRRRRRRRRTHRVSSRRGAVGPPDLQADTRNSGRPRQIEERADGFKDQRLLPVPISKAARLDRAFPRAGCGLLICDRQHRLQRPARPNSACWGDAGARGNASKEGDRLRSGREQASPPRTATPRVRLEGAWQCRSMLIDADCRVELRRAGPQGNPSASIR